jgi:hypothetical protein
MAPKVEVEQLLERVLDASISRSEFRASWPEPGNRDPLHPLWADIDFALEHLPGYVWRSGVNVDRWRESWEFDLIRGHLDRMRAGDGPPSSPWDESDQ